VGYFQHADMNVDDDHALGSRALLAQVERLLASVRDGAAAQRAAWPAVRDALEASANNLAA
jgi:hypothetical protein